MDRFFTYSISNNDDGMIVLDFLRKKGFSRHILTGMKADREALILNGHKAGGRTILNKGDIFQVRLCETIPSEAIVPTLMDISVLFEDEDILVVNKPANMPVHPSAGNYTNTLANGIASYSAQKGESYPFRCINRLDRDTSGALILAKNALSAAILSVQMRERQIRRTYLAVVEGLTPSNGTISAPISRVSDSVIERHVDFEHGEPAITHYQRLDFCSGHSLLEVHLETGRTHQIRVHMGYIGHPLPGDFLYHPVYERFQRQPLHSLQLDFHHPISGHAICLTAPVPEDIVRGFSCCT